MPAEPARIAAATTASEVARIFWVFIVSFHSMVFRGNRMPGTSPGRGRIHSAAKCWDPVQAAPPPATSGVSSASAWVIVRSVTAARNFTELSLASVTQQDPEIAFDGAAQLLVFG